MPHFITYNIYDIDIFVFITYENRNIEIKHSLNQVLIVTNALAESGKIINSSGIWN